MDSLIHEAAPRRLMNATEKARARYVTDKVAQGRRSELAEAVDNIVRGLRVLRDARTDREQDRKDFLSEMVPGLRDQVANIDAAIDADADEFARLPPDPLCMAELDAFLESVK